MQPAPNEAPAEQGQDQQSGQADPLKQMIVQIDQGLTKVSQVIGQQMPDAGKALAALNEQYRQIITKVMGGDQGGGQQAAPQMAPPETQGKPSMPAY